MLLLINISLDLRNNTRYDGHSYNERPTETRMRSIEFPLVLSYN